MANKLENRNELVLFQDRVGQLVVAKRHSISDKELHVEYPVIISIVPSPQGNGQLVANFFPVLFDMLTTDGKNTGVWVYKRDAITETTADTLSEQVTQRYIEMYNKSFGETVAAAPVPSLF